MDEYEGAVRKLSDGQDLRYRQQWENNRRSAAFARFGSPVTPSHIDGSLLPEILALRRKSEKIGLRKVQSHSLSASLCHALVLCYLSVILN
jgi:hypothetical protein